MNLREQGFRFCISPDKQRARWIHPVEYKALYSDWADHTETGEEELLDFLQKPVDKVVQEP